MGYYAMMNMELPGIKHMWSGRLALILCMLALMPITAAWAKPPEGALLLDRILAVVNDDVITQVELNRELELVQKQIRARKMSLPPMDVLRTQVLERIIYRNLQLQLAGNSRIQVDDEAVNRTILRFAAENNLSLSEYRDALQQEGFDFAEYREGMRTEMIIGRLRQRHIINQVVVSNQEVDDFLATQAVQGNAGDEFHLAHILVAVRESASPEDIEQQRQKAQALVNRLRVGADFSQVAMSASDGQQALEGGDLGWRTLGQVPSLFVAVVTGLAEGGISDLIRSPSGFHIVKLVEKRSKLQKNIVTQTKVRHILVRPSELVSSSMAQTRLSQLRQRIQQGDDFAELARANSDDSTSAVNGGDLGWVTPGNMAPEFEQVMARTQPGETSEVFASPFGWHILQVQDRREYDNTEQARIEQAREALRMRKVEEQTEVWLQRLRDEAFVELK